MPEEKQEQTRVRINFSTTAKGLYTPDITAEAETVGTAMSLLDDAWRTLTAWAADRGIPRAGVEQ